MNSHFDFDLVLISLAKKREMGDIRADKACVKLLGLALDPSFSIKIETTPAGYWAGVNYQGGFYQYNADGADQAVMGVIELVKYGK